ncbi:hypothetical protein VTJ49DRAFT_1444 [Mycothermus thermophilus]|uniref:Uncharacterized protein n=1 Tax=Humicola insolens TaxID=85995 RepID=A0ABR3VEF5_HUMIN
MNRRYGQRNLPYNASTYNAGPYASTSPYGSVSPPSQAIQTAPPPPGGMITSPPTSFTSPVPATATLLSTNTSPLQGALSPPTSLWTASAAAPIIEDLCVPPPPMAYPVPAALSAFPPMMPQMQNIYGMPRHTAVYPPASSTQPPTGFLPTAGTMHGMPSARVVGSYPPYAATQQAAIQQEQQRRLLLQQQQQQREEQEQAQQQQQGVGLGFPPQGYEMGRLGTGYPDAVTSGVGGAGPGNGLMDGSSGGVGGGDAADGGVAPLTPVEEALRGFLSPDIGFVGI